MKGNNEDFLTRTLKYAQRQKWPSLLKAFHTAVAKVRRPVTINLSVTLGPMFDVMQRPHYRARQPVVALAVLQAMHCNGQASNCSWCAGCCACR